jgi:hypothetical protein
MSVCVFIGPTLRPQEVTAVIDAVCLPPVAQGDVYRAAQRRPRAIGIVDGFFSGAPSVWHKEILWALSQGIHVFGSGSMGALRAAELHTFGMRGVGRIFEAFRDGVLEDDDEVAVVHGPAETGFLAASEPMVNIRATLARAATAGVLSAEASASAESFAKALFFPQRTWPAILAGALMSDEARAALRAWLPQGRVDQKREDALEMLAAMRETLARPDLPQASFRFEWTNFWDALVAAPAREAASPPGAADQAVIEELRLEGDAAYFQVRVRALLRLFAGLEARRCGVEPTPEVMRAAVTALRSARGLFTRTALDTWMARNGLDERALQRLVADQVRLDAVAPLRGQALDQALLDDLRLSGAHERLAERARRKSEVLAALGEGAGGALRRDTAEARVWFFERRLGRSMPEDVAQFARELGFATLADFDSAVQRERLYLQTGENAGGA